MQIAIIYKIGNPYSLFTLTGCSWGNLITKQIIILDVHSSLQWPCKPFGSQPITKLAAKDVQCPNELSLSEP